MNSSEILRAKIRELENQNQTLEITSNEHLERLNESQKLSNIGSWEWNIKTGEVKWSDSMFLILGIAPNSESPNYALALKYVHEDDKDKYEKSLKNALETKTAYYLENKITKKDNTEISVISKGKCFCDKNGEIFKMIGTVQDITKEKELFDQNLQLLGFTKILSHNVKAPIKTIIGFINLLKSRLYRNATDKDKLYLDSIESCAIELDSKISELLNDALNKN